MTRLSPASMTRQTVIHPTAHWEIAHGSSTEQKIMYCSKEGDYHEAPSQSGPYEGRRQRGRGERGQEDYRTDRHQRQGRKREQGTQSQRKDKVYFLLGPISSPGPSGGVMDQKRGCQEKLIDYTVNIKMINIHTKVTIRTVKICTSL